MAGVVAALSVVSDLARGHPPGEAVRACLLATELARRPKTRYAVGYGARPLIALHGLLPDRTFDAFIRRATSVPIT